MMEGWFRALWKERWRLALWTVPALIMVLFAHRLALPLAGKLANSRAQLAGMRENIYETAWLDSTQGALRRKTELLSAFHASRRSALNREAGIQATLDRIRGLAQKCGIEVVKTTTMLGREDSLGVLKVRVEGFSHYPGLISFFDTLKAGHPDLYLEEMLIRRGGERSQGRLENLLVLHVYGEREGKLQ